MLPPFICELEFHINWMASATNAASPSSSLATPTLSSSVLTTKAALLELNAKRISIEAKIGALKDLAKVFHHSIQSTVPPLYHYHCL
jgi:hypothetical protein